MTNNNKSFWTRTPVKIAVLIIIIIAVALSLNKEDKKVEVITETSDSSRIVSLYDISNDNGSAVKTADGSAFIVRSQSGGRVDKVAKIGDVVKAGATIAELENSAQRAAYIQAEGAYEAVKAAVATTEIDSNEAEIRLRDAKNNLQILNSNAYSTAQSVLNNTIDPKFYANPDSIYPSIRINVLGNNEFLRNERLRYQKVLQQLQNITYNKPDLEEDIKENADYAILELSGLLTITDIFINAVNDNQNKDIYTGLEKTTINTELNIARNNLISTIDNIRRGLSTLNTSKESLDKANINATGQTVSASDAQLKQAFGVLESARSALNKTIIKTPVSGTITAASISVGDIINIGNDVVFVTGDTNTAAVENSVTVPLTAVKFTPTKAYIFSVAEGKLIAHEVKTGLVTSNSITISEFGDVTQIVTDVRGLKAGDAVLVQ